jgi:hypothetical protein
MLRHINSEQEISCRGNGDMEGRVQFLPYTLRKLRALEDGFTVCCLCLLFASSSLYHSEVTTCSEVTRLSGSKREGTRPILI